MKDGESTTNEGVCERCGDKCRKDKVSSACFSTLFLTGDEGSLDDSDELSREKSRGVLRKCVFLCTCVIKMPLESWVLFESLGSAVAGGMPNHCLLFPQLI